MHAGGACCGGRRDQSLARSLPRPVLPGCVEACTRCHNHKTSARALSPSAPVERGARTDLVRLYDLCSQGAAVYLRYTVLRRSAYTHSSNGRKASDQIVKSCANILSLVFGISNYTYTTRRSDAFEVMLEPSTTPLHTAVVLPDGRDEAMDNRPRCIAVMSLESITDIGVEERGRGGGRSGGRVSKCYIVASKGEDVLDRWRGVIQKPSKSRKPCNKHV